MKYVIPGLFLPIYYEWQYPYGWHYTRCT